MRIRPLERSIASRATSDGAGVRLRRSLGADAASRVDPFLLLDEFCSDDPRDYRAGFPPHPHRGFETVTYMLAGRMHHEDSAGHRGELGPGDVQWMTAARGIVHAEMPRQSEGRMHGFQLWLNLPAARKMDPPWYRDIPAAQIPVVALAGGSEAAVIAGRFESADGVRALGPAPERTTDPHYFDLRLAAGAAIELRLPETHAVLLYLYEGLARTGAEDAPLPRQAAAVLGSGEAMRVVAGAAGARLLVLAGRPIGEPVVQYGPFVMTTRDQIEQAIADYQAGRLGAL